MVGSRGSFYGISSLFQGKFEVNKAGRGQKKFEER